MNKSRFFRLFILAFGITLLCLQIYNYIYVKKLDARYSKIITDKTSALQAFAVITRESSDIQNALLQISILNGGNSGKWQQEINQSASRIDSEYTMLEKSVTCKKEIPSLSLLKNSYSKYKTGYQSVLSLLLSGKISNEQASSEVEKLKLTYDSFLQQQEAQIEFFRERAELSSDKLTASTKRTTAMMLFVGTLPYLILVIGLIISFVVILWLGNVVNWFRHQE